MEIILRRIHTTALVLLILTAILSGCGFQLRGLASLPASISPLAIEGVGDDSDLRTALTTQIEDAGVRVISDKGEANSVLRITDRRSDRRITALDRNGKVIEYELLESLRFDLTDDAGRALVAPQAVNVVQSYVNPEIEVLGKQQEEESLRRGMRLDLAGQLVRRLETQLR